MKIHNIKTRLLILAVLMLCFSTLSATAQTTAFTYQGRFTDSTAPQPTNGTYNMQFSMFDAATGSNQIGATVTIPAVSVVNGIFTVSLDYTAAGFDGNARFLQITVGNTVLNPRQEITSAPYAITARKALLANDSTKLGGIDADQYVTGQVVRSVNNLTNSVTLAAGSNITITPSGNTLTIASTGGGSGGSGINNQTSLQTSANFNIDGSGAANVFNATTQFNLGGTRFLSGGGTNVFAGNSAGAAVTTGGDNTFVGTRTGLVNTTGVNNSFFGTDAGRSNTADNNSFFGRSAGFDTAGGSSNSFFGLDSGRFNVAGSNNAFFGRLSGANSKADNNSFVGFQSGGNTSTGGGNSFFGYNAGIANTIGANNTIFGNSANVGASNLTFATAIGAGAVVSTSNTVVLGRTADTVIAPNLLQVGALGVNGTTALCRNVSNQISTCTAGGGTNSGDFIQNQQTSAQSADFSISGSGRVGQFFSAAVVSTETFYRIGTQIILNTPNATSVALGQSSGFNATGANNAFFGTQSGNANTIGTGNSFFGSSAGKLNLTANFNSFFGADSGSANTTGTNNAFFGYQSGKATTGGGNAFFGSLAGSGNTSGFENTFVGNNAGSGNGGGSKNTIVGSGSFLAGSNNTAVGNNTTTIGSNNTLLGFNSVINGGATHSTVIGADAITNKSNTILLGTTDDTVEAPNLLTAKNINVSSKVNAFTVDAGLGIFDAIKLNNTPFGDKPLCLKTTTKEIGVCPATLNSQNEQGTILLTAAVKEQNAQIDKQAEQIKQQQAQIEELKQIVCAINPAAKICGK